MVDVAAVTRLMWAEVLSDAARNRINQKLCVEDASKLVAMIAGLHDLGKCSPPFALRGIAEKSNQETVKLLDLYRDSDLWSTEFSKSVDAPHGFVTTIELPAFLVKLGLNPTVADQIGVLIGGHHGIFPDSLWRRNGKRDVTRNVGNELWGKSRQSLATALADLLQIEAIEQSREVKLDNGSIMILAGLVSVADWIGSNTEFFDCAVEDFSLPDFGLKQGSLDDYFAYAKTQSRKALSSLGWLNWASYGEEKTFGDLFSDMKPRGLQNTAIEISNELDSAGIVVIESPMGEGKTEAAMFLADHFNTKLKQRGIYFALPTQATSNQMFDRVKEFLSKRFDQGIINLQLQHGHSSLSAEFAMLKDNFNQIKDVFEECCGDDCAPHVAAAEWFTYRKRGLLAPFGVGTIDQALMAVLQTKHVFVRLFGLSHKTVIIDEVHAYDAYMTTLLERLLEWLAALGSPVILLSATLPKNRRNALLHAYQRGLGVVQTTAENVSYPRISYSTAATTGVRHIATSAKSQTLHIEKVGEDFVEKLREKLKTGGGCVAIICNTVQRSQEMFKMLDEHDFFKGSVDLLHARFRYCDRELRETRVLKNFGKGEGSQRPKMSVLVATQIIEQSLDIDFDLMISDLAPIDLLLQRAGRLHRHERTRPECLKTPTLWIIDPPTSDSGQLLPDSKGLPYFGEAGAIYDSHILLRSWLSVEKMNRIEIPLHIEKLVEAIYDLDTSAENLDPDLRKLWNSSSVRCLSNIRSDNNQAETRFIKSPYYGRQLSGIFTNNLEEDSPDVNQTLQAKTRLTEPTVAVVCLWEKDGKTFLERDCSQEVKISETTNFELTKEILRRSVQISKKAVVFDLLNEIVPPAFKTSPLLRNHRALIFDERQRCQRAGHTFILHDDVGLQILREETTNA